MMKLKNKIKTININNILFNYLLKGFLENNKINFHLNKKIKINQFLHNKKQQKNGN